MIKDIHMIYKKLQFDKKYFRKKKTKEELKGSKDKNEKTGLHSFSNEL